ncbi:MAG: hypothetical protein ACOYL6_00725 [Bacteriovoracaceae bacterium]
MKIILISFFFSFSVFANIDDSLFDKVKWSYEVFESEPQSVNFQKSIEKGSPSSARTLGFSEKVNVPLKDIECFMNVPWIRVSTPSLVDRDFYCHERGRSNTFRISSSISCGIAKKKDISKTYIYGNFCESEKKCYEKSYMVIFSCSI